MKKQPSFLSIACLVIAGFIGFAAEFGWLLPKMISYPDDIIVLAGILIGIVSLYPYYKLGCKIRTDIIKFMEAHNEQKTVD